MADVKNDYSDLILWGRRILQKEAEALTALVSTLDDSFAEACQWIYHCRGTVVLTGMGKSGIVARKWASTFASTGTRAYFLNPAEAPHGDLGILRAEDILIALSYSGETLELGHVLRHATQNGVFCLGITGNPVSSLAQQCSLALFVKLSEEACPLGLAPTTSTTLMMALGDAIAMTLMQMRGFTEKDFARLHPGGTLGRRYWLRAADLMHSGDALPIVGPKERFDDLLVEMTKKRLGLAVVMERDRILGIITDGDLRRAFQQKLVSASTVAADLMTRNPRTVDIGALASEARELMERHSIQQLLILENGKLAGAVHLYDLLRARVG